MWDDRGIALSCVSMAAFSGSSSRIAASRHAGCSLSVERGGYGGGDGCPAAFGQHVCGFLDIMIELGPTGTSHD